MRILSVLSQIKRYNLVSASPLVIGPFSLVSTHMPTVLAVSGISTLAGTVDGGSMLGKCNPGPGLDLTVLSNMPRKHLSLYQGLCNKLIKSAYISTFSILGIANVAAQSSAGSLLQEIQSQAPDATLPTPVLNQEIKIERAAPKGNLNSPSFLVKEFKFVGNTKVTSQEIDVLVSDYLGRRITFADLKEVTDLIAEYYRAHGWLAKVFLPEQDIINGVVLIRIVEATLGGLIIDNHSKGVSNARIEEWVYSHVHVSAELSLHDLDRAILTLNDLPDIAVASSLQEGKNPGEVVLRLVVSDKPVVNGAVSADNYGDSSTGHGRAMASLNVNGPLGFGEQLNVFGIYSEGLSYGRAGLTMPVGSDGVRIGINGSAMNYRVINQSFNSLWANGNASTGGVEMTYPIIRTRPTNLLFISNWNYNNFKNWNITGLLPEQSYDTNVFLAGLSGNMLDEFGGGGINTASLMLSGGNINRNSNSLFNQAYGVSGSFAKLRYAANRTQTVADGLSAFISFSGQTASKNMDSSEQLYLGGPLSVRAYATGQGAASQGNLTTAELRQNLPYQTQLVAFYDYAYIQNWKFSTPLTDAGNTYQLQGFGASLVWSGPERLQVKLTWAQRTGNLPNQTAQYLNSNGGTSANRYWLTASLPI